MTDVRIPLQRLAVRVVTLGLLSAFVAELALPAVVAAWVPEPGTTTTVVEGRSPDHGTTDHHHPGCPWRGRGPCPHQKAAESARGPILTACAGTPAAAADGTARLLLDHRPILDWSLRPMGSRESSNPLWMDPPTHHPAPETPPPRFLPTL